MRIVLVMILLVIGCNKDNPNYDGGVISCTESNAMCVCLNRTCVECTAEDERNCSGTTPQCGNDNRCRACRTNDDCDSGACLEDGSCASADEVIYAAPSGVGTAGCGQKLGENECSLAQALIEVAPPRDVIRLAPGTYTVTGGQDGLDFNTKSATVVARSATITRMGNGAIMSARSSQRLKLIGGTVQGPNNDDGLKCNTGGELIVHETMIERMTQSGIETDACKLTVSRATIRNNLEGGIKMVNTARPVTITNNFVYRNGGAGSPVGGMALRLEHPGSKVEFNTVADNEAESGNAATAGGIACEGQGYDALFNLVYRNEGGLDGKYQVVGTCTFQGSFQQAAMSPTENVVGFENPEGATPSFRLTDASPTGTIRDAFACANLIDFDGQARPAPAAPPVVMADKCDHGADEFYGR